MAEQKTETTEDQKSAPEQTKPTKAQKQKAPEQSVKAAPETAPIDPQQKSVVDVISKGDTLTVDGYEIFSYNVVDIDRLDETMMKFRQRDGVFEDDLVIVLRKK
jgi:P pilus assembly chaperone PapD